MPTLKGKNMRGWQLAVSIYVFLILRELMYLPLVYIAMWAPMSEALL